MAELADFDFQSCEPGLTTTLPVLPSTSTITAILFIPHIRLENDLEASFLLVKGYQMWSGCGGLDSEGY